MISYLKRQRSLLCLVFLIVFGNNLNAQSEFVQEHYIPGHVSITNFEYDMKLNDKRIDGFVHAVPRFSTSVNDPLIYTSDEEGALSGFSKKYAMDDVARMHLISLKNGTTGDGFFFIGPFEQANQHDYLVRLDNSGSVLWSMQMAFKDDYGDYKKAEYLQAIQTKDGNILVVGSFNYTSGPVSGDPPRKLLLMKVKASSGAIISQHMISSTDLPDGFVPTEVVETTPDNFYVIGGISSHYKNFILNADLSGTSLAMNLVRIYTTNNTYFEHILVKGEDLIVLGNGSNGEICAFKIDPSLSSYNSLGGVSGTYDRYSSSKYFFMKDAVLFNDRIAFSSSNDESVSGVTYWWACLSQLTASGDVYSWNRFYDHTYWTSHHQLFSEVDALINIDHHPKTGGGVTTRVTSFSPAGTTCENYDLTVSRSQVNFSIIPQSVSSEVGNMKYENLTVTASDYTITESDICEDCFLTEAETGPITTSTGGNTLCGIGSMTLYAPTSGTYSYEWFHDGDTFAGDVSSVFITEEGTYSVIITDEDGCSVELIIEILPDVDLSDVDGSSYCLGYSYPLPGYDGGEWSGSGVVETITGDYYFSPLSAGSYVLTYCDINGCCDDAYVTVIDPSIEIVNLDGECAGDCSGSVEVTADGANYTWSLLEAGGLVIATTGPSTSATFTSLCAGDYEIIATGYDAPHCKSSIEFTITSGGWHKQTVNTMGTDIANDVVTDSEGNVYVVGTFTETTEIEGGGNPAIMIDSDGSTYGTMFLAKYDDCGTLLWAAHSSKAPLCSGRGLILDETNGMVYVTGELRQKALFHSAESADGLCGSGYTQYLDAPLSKRGYVAQYDMATGCLYFAEKFDDGAEQETSSITINENTGEIFVGGSYKYTYGAAEEYIFIRKYSPDVLYGTSNTLNPVIWTLYDNTSGTDQWNRINNMDFDESRNYLYAVGDYHRRMKVLTSTITHGSMYHDAFLLTVRDYGTGRAVFNLRGGNGSPNGFMTGEGVAVDNSSGTVFITGSYNEPNSSPFFFVGIDPLSSYSPNSKSYMLAGSLVGSFSPWARNTVASPASSGWIRGKDVTFKGNQAIFCNEFSGNSLSVAPGGGFGTSYPFVGNPTGVGHIGIVSYDISGTRDWVNVTESVWSSSTDDHISEAITFGKSGTAFIAGAFRNTLSYNSGAPFSGDLYYSGIAGGYNGCVLRIQKSTGALERASNSSQEEVKLTDLDVTLSPNPASTTITLKQTEAVRTKVKIYDVSGKIVCEKVFNDVSCNIPIDELSPGTYLVRVENASKVATLPFIKQ